MITKNPINRIDEILAQLSHLNSEIQSIKDSLQTVAVQKSVKWKPKLNKYLLGYKADILELDADDIANMSEAAYIGTRATPELAKADSIALHRFSTLLAYRAEFWPDFVLQLQDFVGGEKVCAVLSHNNGMYSVVEFTGLSMRSLDVYFPASATNQLQAALANGLLDLPSN